MARILIVEDDKYLNKLITDRFILEGFEVQSVLDGESAWDLLSRAQGSEKPFDVLLSDMLLPRLMGAQLFAKAQEVQKTHPLRLIAMSGIYKNPAETDETEENQGDSEGFHDWEHSTSA
jgi:DNA-binding response OmpR family regulator